MAVGKLAPSFVAKQRWLHASHPSFPTGLQQNPHQYLSERRAKELLDASDLTVTDVCFEVGFESLGSFSSLFRKAVGVSPASYRARLAQPSAIFAQAEPLAIPACFLLKFSPSPAR